MVLIKGNSGNFLELAQTPFALYKNSHLHLFETSKISSLKFQGEVMMMNKILSDWVFCKILITIIMKKNKIFIEIVVLLLVVLFLYTAVSKFVDFKGFTYDLNNQPFPNSLTPFLKWLLPITEISIVISLLFEKTRSIGLHASFIVMSIFTIYTGLVLFHVFEYVPCSCGGVIKNLTWPQHLIFNLFFVFIIGLAIKATKDDKNSQLFYNQLQ